MCGFFVAVLLTGIYSDRRGKLPSLLAGSIAMAFGLCLFAMSHSFNTALLAVLIVGVGGGCVEGTSTALLADLYSGSDRTSMMNLSQAFFGIGAVAGPMAVGYLLKTNVDWRLAYYGAAALSILNAILAFGTFSLRMETPVQTHDSNCHVKGIFSNPLILWLTLGMLFYVGAESGPASWLAAYFKHDLHAAGWMAANSLAFFWGGILFGRVLGALVSRVMSDSCLLRWSIILAAVSQAALLLMHSPIHGLVACATLGICLGPIFPTITSLAGAKYPEQSGTVIGLAIAGASLGGVIFTPTIGWLASSIGMRHALWICILALTANFIIVQIVSRKRRQPI